MIVVMMMTTTTTTMMMMMMMTFLLLLVYVVRHRMLSKEQELRNAHKQHDEELRSARRHSDEQLEQCHQQHRTTVAKVSCFSSFHCYFSLFLFFCPLSSFKLDGWIPSIKMLPVLFVLILERSGGIGMNDVKYGQNCFTGLDFADFAAELLELLAPILEVLAANLHCWGSNELAKDGSSGVK